MLQEMMGFFLGGATPKVWLITAFCTGSIYDEKHTHKNMLELPHVYCSDLKDEVGDIFWFQRVV